MTKQQCLNELDSIIESTRNSAVYITACNYHDTVSSLSEENFHIVSDWYAFEIYKFNRTQGRIG